MFGWKQHLQPTAPLTVRSTICLPRLHQQLINPLCCGSLRVTLTIVLSSHSCINLAADFQNLILLRRAFHRFYKKFLETAFPIEDMYLEWRKHGCQRHRLLCVIKSFWCRTPVKAFSVGWKCPPQDPKETENNHKLCIINIKLRYWTHFKTSFYFCNLHKVLSLKQRK